LRTTIAIAWLLAAGGAAMFLVGTASPAHSVQLSPCPELGPKAGPPARKYELRCLVNETRIRRGRSRLAASTSLRLVAERLLTVQCRRGSGGCGANFEGVLARALRARGYAGKVRYVYYDASNDPGLLAGYLRRSQSWLSSRLYRDLGVAFRPAGARPKPVWIVVAGYRY
jgi:hypothetical protein